MSRRLFHLPLSAASRKVRLVLGEKGLGFVLEVERIWERRLEFMQLNPAGDVPVLIEPDGTVLSGGQVIAEFLEESYPAVDLLGNTAAQRAETRRLVAWFDEKFAAEVGDNLVGEKFMKRMFELGDPSAPAIRAGLANIHYHLDYIAYLTERHRWMAGNEFSLADITAAAHISTIDYFGDVPWDAHQPAKDWYVRVKSRPSFRPILSDYVSGMTAPKHYADLDF
jgi:glutathione S-transferase